MAYNREAEIRKEHNRIRKCLAQNLCFICNTPPVPGRKYCERHLAYYRQRNRAKRERFVAEGKCVCCGAPLSDVEKEGGRRSCMYCAHNSYSTSKGRLKYGDFSIREALEMGIDPGGR